MSQDNIPLIVTGTVRLEGVRIARQGFGIGLGLFLISDTVQADRYKLYSSLTELTDAGFATTDNAYRWASAVLSQGAEFFALGRRDDTGAAKQVDTVTITTADVGVWSVTINSVAYAYTAIASDDAESIAAGLKAVIDARVGDQTYTTGAVTGAGPYTFEVTANVAGVGFTNGGIVVPGAGVGTFTNTTANGAPTESITDALNAVNAFNSDWYYLNIESRADSDIQEAAAWVAARRGEGDVVVGVYQSSDPNGLTGATPNIADTLAALSYRGQQVRWHHDDSAYSDGAMVGRAATFDLDAPAGAATWFGKSLVGIDVARQSNGQPLNRAQLTTLDGEGFDSYALIANIPATYNGIDVTREFMDVTTTMDWTTVRLNEDYAALLLGASTKIPYTNAGLTSIATVMRGRLESGVENGHFSPDAPRTVTVADVNDVPQQDKADRCARVTGSAVLAGAIQKVIYTVTVEA